MNIIYIIWGLVPLSLLLLTISAVLKKIKKTENKDHPLFYFKQFIFTLIILVITIVLDSSLFYSLFEKDGAVFYISDDVLLKVLNFFLYPLMLLIAASLQEFYKKHSV